MVSLGVDAAIIDTLSQTPLFYASRDGKLNLIDMFVKAGCQVN